MESRDRIIKKLSNMVRVYKDREVALGFSAPPRSRSDSETQPVGRPGKVCVILLVVFSGNLSPFLIQRLYSKWLRCIFRRILTMGHVFRIRHPVMPHFEFE